MNDNIYVDIRSLTDEEFRDAVEKNYPQWHLYTAAEMRAESKLAVWRETLEKCVGYAQHHPKCEERVTEPCTCGLDAALSAARELLEVKDG